MKRPITKLFSIVLSLASLLGMSAVPVMAETTYLDTLNENYTWTFSESTNVADYVEYGTYTTVDKDSTVLPDKGASIVKDGDNDVLKIEDTTKYYKASTRIWTFSNFADKDKVPHLGYKFSFKRPAADNAAEFNVALRENDGENKQYSVLYMHNGNIYFLGMKVCTYTADVWYDVAMEFDLTQCYGRISVKEQGAQNAFVADVVFEKMYSPNFGTESDVTTVATKNLTGIGFVWGNANGSATAYPYATIYIDNVCQYDIEAGALTPTLNAISDNTSLWKLENNDANHSSLSVDGGAVTVSENDSTSHKYPQLAIAPFHRGYDVRHRVRFDIEASSFSDSAHLEFKVSFADGSGTLKAADKKSTTGADRTIMKLTGEILNLVGGSDISIATESGKPYACDFVYDAAKKIALISVTAPDGTVYQQDVATFLNDNIFKDEADWLKLFEIRVNCRSSKDETWTMTLDNFKWDVLSRSAVNASASVKAADSGAASMDETVIIDYGRPVNNAATLGDAVSGGGATVSVTANGDTVSEGSALTTQDGKVFVKFSDLEPSTEYTVTVSGVTLLESDMTTVPNATATFTTWNTDLAASAPSVTGDVISANVISGYADGTDVMLIAALYQDGELSKVLTNPAIAKSRDGEAITLSLAGETYESVQIFVWDSFEAMRPLTAMVPYPNI